MKDPGTFVVAVLAIVGASAYLGAEFQRWRARRSAERKVRAMFNLREAEADPAPSWYFSGVPSPRTCCRREAPCARHRVN